MPTEKNILCTEAPGVWLVGFEALGAFQSLPWECRLDGMQKVPSHQQMESDKTLDVRM